MAHLTEPSIDDIALIRVVTAMYRQLMREHDRQLHRQSGLSQGDYSVLMMVKGSATHRLRAGELGELLAWETSRVSHQLSRMEQRGLVLRTTDALDGRGTWVGLTAKGDEAAASAERRFADVIQRTFSDHLDDDDKRTFADVSLRVLAHLNPTAYELAGYEALIYPSSGESERAG